MSSPHPISCISCAQMGLELARAPWVIGALLAAGAWLLNTVLLRWWRFYRTVGAIPTPNHGKGHVKVLSDPRHHREMARWTDEIGPVYLLRLYWERIVIVADPVLATSLLKHSPDGDKSSTYNVINGVGSAHKLPGLFSASSNSPYWKLVRKGVAPAFNPKSLRQSFPKIVAAAQEAASALRSLGSTQAVDIDELLQRQSLDIISRVGFGVDLRAVQGFKPPAEGHQAGSATSDQDPFEHIFHHLKGAMDEVNVRWADPLREHCWWLFPSGWEGERHFAAFRGHMERLLGMLRANGPPAEDDNSIAAHLLRLRDPATGQPLPDERLLPEIATFFVAGFDTAAHTMAWTLYLISQHPDVEARLCQELRGLGLLATPEQPSPRCFEYEDLGKLPYLTACIKESMRMLPVGAEGTVRVFPRDMQLGSYVVPAGTMIWVHTFAMHNSLLYWESPGQYMPERWLTPGAEYYTGAAGRPGVAPAAGKAEEAAVVPPPPGAGADPGDTGGSSSPQGPVAPLRYIPFSTGPRGCVGEPLARLNYTATLAILLGQFSFKLDPEMEGPGGIADSDVVRLTLQPDKGLFMTSVPRG